MSADRNENVRTAGRTLLIFEEFANRQEPMSLSELAVRIGSPVSSVHALVKTLRKLGYVYVLDERKLIYPTRRILDIAKRISVNDPVVAVCQPAMARLQERTGETIILGKLQNDVIVYLNVVESAHSIRYSARPGDLKPLFSSAVGKSMLGQMTDDELGKLLEKRNLPAVTSNTITDPVKLLADVKEGRERNYYVTRGENVGDVMGIASTVAFAGEVVGLAIAGPISRLQSREAENAELLLQAVQEIRSAAGE